MAPTLPLRDALTYKGNLPLVRGAPPRRLSVRELIHFIWILLPWFSIRVPHIIIFKHLLPWLTKYHYKSSITEEIGRRWIPDVFNRTTGYVLTRCTPIQGRATLFGRSVPYSLMYLDPVWRDHHDWRKEVREPGFTGRWLANPRYERRDDDLVLFYVHGGGFVIDTGGFTQRYWLELMKEMAFKNGRRFSIFQLDYELAPEYIYPSQIIETVAGYSYLVNKLGINPERICISGDSAGGNIIMGTLLHLARPNPEISLPASFAASSLKRPGAALIISPECKVISHNPSRKANQEFDVIEDRSALAAALEYIGAGSRDKIEQPTFWPRHLFYTPEHEFDIEDPKPHGPRLPSEPKIENEDQMALIRRRFADPYVNPAMVDDLKWWKEALPERTMVVYGGKEIFFDDIEQFCNDAVAAGVKIDKVVKPLGSHDWLLYDWAVPFLCETHSRGPDFQKQYGVNKVASFLCEVIAQHKGERAPQRPVPLVPVKANL